MTFFTMVMVPRAQSDGVVVQIARRTGTLRLSPLSLFIGWKLQVEIVVSQLLPHRGIGLGVHVQSVLEYIGHARHDGAL